MMRFTKLEKQQPEESEKFVGSDIEIINYKEWDIINGKDKMVILPYLKDEGYVLLRYENIPTFQYKYKEVEGYRNVNNFITVIKGDINEENTLQAVRRILHEETGIVLNANYPITVDKNLFKDEKNLGQYYICLLELNYNDFRQGPSPKPQDDVNQIVKISLGDVDELKTFDLITDYMILRLKYEYKL